MDFDVDWCFLYDCLPSYKFRGCIESINLNVIGFLFGMFSIVASLDKSGVLKLVAIKMLSRANNLD